MDRLLGAGFGLLKAALIGVVLVLALSSFSVRPLPDSVAGSRLAPVLIEVGRVAAALAPKEMRDGFDRSYENLKKFWNERLKPQIDKKVKDTATLPAATA
jgi:membrane protein required for colicin V production